MGTQAIFFRGSRERLSSGEPEGHSQTELLNATQPLAAVRDVVEPGMEVKATP